ncbi:MAG TPA: DUF4145 domain-containing protein [Pyrinomonadaceae bacterium]|nr:DUF4145 domain-containing protein [Pyrinomonadaceae bacterium]
MSLVVIKDGFTRTVHLSNLVLEPPPNLNPALASDLREACACFNAEAYKASVVMARRFLEAYLDKRGFKGRTLADRITNAHASGAISAIVFQLASSARILGNYGAHYSDDRLAAIGEDEAELVLNILRQILKNLS